MKLNRFGNVRPSEYSRIVTGLKKPRNEKSRNFRYFSKPDLRTPRPPRKGSLYDKIGQGVYRIKGYGPRPTLQKLMSYTDRTSTCRSALTTTTLSRTTATLSSQGSLAVI